MPALAVSPTQILAPPTVLAAPSTAPAHPCLPAGTVRGAKIVSLSVYGAGSGQALPFMLAGSSHSVRLLTVTGRDDGPVVLVLSAYEPILWDLSAVQGRVKAVIASGYSPQAVRGVASGVPVRFSSAVGTFNGSQTCARIHYAYDAIADIQGQAAEIRQAVGRFPRAFYGASTAERLNIDGPGVAGAPTFDFAEIRAAVPLVTKDDPGSLAQMKMLPDEQPQGEGAVRVVEFSPSGDVIRDELGGRPAGVRPDPDFPMPPRSDTVYRRRGLSVSGALAWLVVIGTIGFALWRRLGRVRIETEPPFTAVRPYETKSAGQSEAASADSAPPPFKTQLRDLAELASLTDCEPLVMALHRFAREVQAVAQLSLDADLAAEVDAIAGQHLNHALSRYRRVRASLDGAEGERADEMLTRAVERLAGRLHELRTEQQHRAIDGVDEAARFIDARHPI